MQVLSCLCGELAGHSARIGDAIGEDNSNYVATQHAHLSTIRRNAMEQKALRLLSLITTSPLFL
jgi:hypothetical protein